jgi:NAD+ synthase (glutamine-hydrolysing)
MKYVNIAGACLNQTALDIPHNVRNIVQAIEAARAEKVSILCLPEMAITSYGCEDMYFSEAVTQRSLEALEEIASHTQGIAVSVGLPLVFENRLYNTCALLYDKQIWGFVAKQELAGDGIYYEPRWFKTWPEKLVVDYKWQGKSYPLGDVLFELDGIRIGFEICEDAWNGVRPAQRHYRHNVDLILNPSASNFAFGKTQVREMLVTEASRSYNCTYVYSNLLGNDSGRIIYDGEILIAQDGKLLARNQRFSFADFRILPAVVDLEAVHIRRKKSFNFEPELPPYLVEIPASLPKPERSPKPQLVAPEEAWEEEFWLAETLGLFDYMRKSRSRGFVLSLSGGADSSCCAALIAKTFERAEQQLGREKLLEKLAYAQLDPEQAIVTQLFTCVYQATENSGDATLESARELAQGLGARFHAWDVESLHQGYKALAAEALGRPLSWEQDDLALQNIQARLRAPGVWMLANIQRALLITTSNRSEAAVGYATMDGDTAGGLAPLGGIDKESVINWLHWAEEALDIPSLRYVNSLAPMAELRPADYDQTDEGDLMPYPILELIEEQAIGEYKSPVEVFHSLRGKVEDAVLKRYIRKFFQLWSRNQWKRERYAPSFHLDDKNLDPKTWCRFPILNGGYWEGLQELEEEG